MVVEAVSVTQREDCDATAPVYVLFGMRVQSDCALPLDAQGGGECDVVIRRMPDSATRPTRLGVPLALMRCEHGTIQCARYVRPDGTWIDRGDVLFHIAPTNDRVDVYTDSNFDQLELALLLMSLVAVFLLRARRKLILHTSAVITPNGTAAFLAPKGGGKSSLAAGFVYEGDALLTDDVLVISLGEASSVALPGPAIMKLWQQTLDALETRHRQHPSLFPGFDKKLLRLNEEQHLARSTQRLCALYLVDRYEPDNISGHSIEITSVGGTVALAALIAQTSWGELLAPREVAMLLPGYARLLQQVPLRTLRYPSGFQYQEAVRTAIVEDLQRR